MIYVKRGLEKELAMKVAEQLSAHDRLGAHMRDELGIDQTRSRARCRPRGSRRRASRSSRWFRSWPARRARGAANPGDRRRLAA